MPNYRTLQVGFEHWPDHILTELEIETSVPIQIETEFGPPGDGRLYRLKIPGEMAGFFLSVVAKCVRRGVRNERYCLQYRGPERVEEALNDES